ncbi:hypothetical protein ACVBEF_17935 [Glaciimonas sp. GG7]
MSDSQVNVFAVNNAATGNINATQSVNISANPATDYQLSFSSSKLVYAATDGSSTKAIAVISGIYTDDNINAVNINNAGNLNAQGSFSAAYYGRADTTITNTGTIQNTSWTSTISGSTGGLFTSYGNTRTIYNVAVIDTSGLSLDNAGTIKGDLLVIDTTPTTWAAAQAQNINPSYLVASGSSAGPRDSNVSNSGTITGNVFLGSGTHVWDNSGTINGNIHVDQGGGIATFAVLSPLSPPTHYLYTTAGSTTTGTTGAACAVSGGTNDPFCALTTKVLGAYVGGQTFNLSNSGTINGNLSIANLMSASQITFSPTITGNGVGSSLTNPSGQINGINGI